MSIASRSRSPRVCRVSFLILLALILPGVYVSSNFESFLEVRRDDPMSLFLLLGESTLLFGNDLESWDYAWGLFLACEGVSLIFAALGGTSCWFFLIKWGTLVDLTGARGSGDFWRLAFDGAFGLSFFLDLFVFSLVVCYAPGERLPAFLFDLPRF